MQLITSYPLHDLRRQSWADSDAGIQSHVALPRLCINSGRGNPSRHTRTHIENPNTRKQIASVVPRERPRRSTHCCCLRRSHPVRRVHGCAGEQASGTVLLVILHLERSNKVFGERLRRDCSLLLRLVYFDYFLYVAMSSKAEKVAAAKKTADE